MVIKLTNTQSSDSSLSFSVVRNLYSQLQGNEMDERDVKTITALLYSSSTVSSGCDELREPVCQRTGCDISKLVEFSCRKKIMLYCANITNFIIETKFDVENITA